MMILFKDNYVVVPLKFYIKLLKAYVEMKAIKKMSCVDKCKK